MEEGMQFSRLLQRSLFGPGRIVCPLTPSSLTKKPVRNKCASALDDAYVDYEPPQFFTPLPSHVRTPEEAVTEILNNTPSPPKTKRPARHVINCLLRNECGVLARISGVLAARKFNIESIVGAQTEIPDLSRMTITMREPRDIVDNVIRQLEDLVPVWAVLDYQDLKTVERELLLVKVSTIGPDTSRLLPQARAEQFQTLCQTGNILTSLTELTKIFGGKMVDVCPESVIIELSAKSERVDAFINLLRAYGILEASRTGAMVMSHSDLTAYSLAGEDFESEVSSVDHSRLPPG